MKRVLFILATVMSLPFAEAGIRPFADGERIAFLGDSITHGGGYVADLQVAWKVRHPGSRPVFLNAGIGGDTAKRGFDRVETDLAAMRPDRVVVMFGMNDVNTGKAYFEEWMTKLCDALDAKGWKVDLMTPTPYDEWNTNLTAKVSKPRQEPALGDCAAFVRELAAKRGYGLVELHDPLVRILKENPERRYLADRVHPGEPGHRIIAARILEAAGEDKVDPDTIVPKDMIAARDRLLAVQRKRRTLAEYERTLREQKIDPNDRAAAFAALDRRREDLRKRIPAADAKWHEGQQRMFKETLYGRGAELEAQEDAARAALLACDWTDRP